MIKKKLLVCILLGASLSACDMTKSSSVGDDANPNTNGNGAYVNQESTMVLSAGKNSSQSAKVAPLITTLLTMGVKEAAKAMGTSFGKGILSKIMGDPNQKLYERFDKIDTQLAEINKNVQLQLEISSDTLKMLQQLYLDFMKTSFDDKLYNVNQELQAINSKNSTFAANSAYGQFDSNDLDQIYKNAELHKNDYITLNTIGAINASKLSGGSGLSVDPKSTLILYNEFINEFVVGVNNSGNVLNLLKDNKTNFLNLLGNVGIEDNKNMLLYINDYNNKVINIRLQLILGLQKLYNMQLTQLAYYYAAKADLDVKFTSSDPSNPFPAQKSGLTGFKQAAQLLSDSYMNDFNRLNNSFKEYLPLISITDVYNQINTKWFNSQQQLLVSDTFQNPIDEQSTLPANFRQCEVNGLSFQPIEPSGKYVLANLAINCYLGNNQWKATKVVFPVVKEGTKIARYAYSSISAKADNKLSIDSGETLKLQLTSDDIKAFAEQTSSSANIKGGSVKDMVDRHQTFTDNEDYDYWTKKAKDKKDVVLFSTTLVEVGLFSDDISWAAGDFELKDNGVATTRILPITYYDGNKGDNPVHFRRARELRFYSPVTGQNVYNIRFSKEGKVKDGRKRNAPETYFYNLASYKNHWFAIKMIMGYDGMAAVQALGIGCIDSSCSRVSNTTLSWTSGATVKLTPPNVVSGQNIDGEYQTQITGTGN